MFKKKNNRLEELVDLQNKVDRYILDDENAVIVIENPNRENGNDYISIHERLIDGELKEINRWYNVSYFFGAISCFTPIRELGLFKIQGCRGQFSGLYDYKNDKFIIPQNLWDSIETDVIGSDNDFLKKYNGFLGEFSVRSDYEQGDVYCYKNPITNKEFVKGFCVEEKFYGIIDLDGTLRGNKLFKGKSFSEIESIIDLDEYKSLEEFKRLKKEECNKKKEQNKEEYKLLISSRNDGSTSPYLDNEVIKILNLKK